MKSKFNDSANVCPYKIEPGDNCQSDSQSYGSENVNLKGNILYKYTRKSLKENKVRTAVTIIGIILSMALMVAVLEGAYSGVRYLVCTEIEVEGAWHGAMCEIDKAQVDDLAAMGEVEDVSFWQRAGWAVVESSNEYKPYLLIESLTEDDESNDLVKIRLTQGRYPENGSEIIIPEHLKSNGDVNWKIGDTITLNIGRRVSDGYELTPANPYYPEQNEEIVDTSARTFTIVGVFERLRRSIEAYECPGYTAFTKGNTGGSFTAFYTLKNPRSYYKFINSQNITDNIFSHSGLLMYYGVTGFSNINLVLYGFVGILLFLIAFGSISLIYNSFAISVSERTRQLGILKSVGATKKQIRSSVLYEAVLLTTIAIPLGAIVGCAGIGLTLYLLKDSFNRLTTVSTDTEMRLVLNPWILITAAALCLITTLISAWLPAIRAMRISPIDAIRQSRDIKIRGRSVRTSALTRKIFGFEGMMAAKNFKRSRKRYRSVVFSLSLSIILFVSASSLSAYMKRSLQGATYDSNPTYDISWSFTGSKERDFRNQLIKDIRAFNSVDKAALTAGALSNETLVDNDLLTDQVLNSTMIEALGDNKNMSMFDLRFLDDETFLEMLGEYGLKADLYFDADMPRAVVYNQVSYAVVDQEKGKVTWYVHDFFNNNAEGASINMYLPEKIDGYEYSYFTGGEDGTLNAVYYKKNLSNKAEDGSQVISVDTEDSLVLPAGGCCSTSGLNIGTLVSGERKYYENSGFVIFMYPYSMMKYVLPEDTMRYDLAVNDNTLYVLAAAHAAAKTDIEQYRDQHELSGSVYDLAEEKEMMRMVITIINVFAFGFIILISLIAAANIFNTISTNVSLRRREFAMLRSVGLSERGFGKMMNYECLIYGIRGLLWGLPLALLVTWVMWKINSDAVEMNFFIPWYSIAIAAGSVFIVVFVTMLYASGRIRKDNMIEALKNENI